MSFYNQSTGFPSGGQPPRRRNNDSASTNFYSMQNNNAPRQQQAPTNFYAQQQPPQQQPQQQHATRSYYQSQPTATAAMNVQQPQQYHQPTMSPTMPSAPTPMTSTSATPQQNPANVTPGVPSMPNLFNPAAATATAAQVLMSDNKEDAIKKIITNVPGRMTPGIGRIVDTLKVYFAVDNNYVKKKMQRILFPFIFKGWKRTELDPVVHQPNPDGSYNPSVVQYALPVADVNAPDLYIPAMSLLTYVLLSAVLYGSSGEFTPEVIPDVCTKCFATQILEVLIIRVGFYSMQVTTPLLDLLAYTGYKYLGLCVNMLVGLFGFGRTGYYVGFVWTATCVSFVMLKVMSNCIPKHTATAGPKREMMVLAFAASQFATMWFVSQTKYLR